MLTEVRWQKEQELMQSVFPEFKAFVRGTHFGFEGYLKGPSSGQIYGVTLEADKATYPQSPPSACMHPRIGIHWIGEGDSRRLCMEREWRPARSTFANTLLALVKYLSEHDPHPRPITQRHTDGGDPQTPGDSGRDPDAGATLWAMLRFLRGQGPY